MNSSEIRMKEHIGIVTSDADTARFSFFVNPLKNKISIGKGDFVILDHPTNGDYCPLLAVVKEVKNYEEIVGATLSDRAIKTIASGEIIGSVDLRSEDIPLKKLFVPPNPGSKVYLPYREFLEDLLSRDLKGRRFAHALRIGSLESTAVSRNGDANPLDFFLNSEDLKNHMLISGMPRVGKTHAATVIIEELVNKTTLPIIVFDPFGEYNTICFLGKNLEKAVAEGRISIRDYPFSFNVVIYTCEPERVKSDLERTGLDRSRVIVIERFPKKITESADLSTFLEFVESLKLKENCIIVLEGKKMGKDERKAFYSCILRSFREAGITGALSPSVLVLEDAENLETEALRGIVSEGNRIGVSTLIISRHPSKLDDNALSQVGTFLVGRMVDAADIELLKNVTLDKTPFLPQLMSGEFILNGIFSRQPTKILVREVYSVKM